MQKIMLVLLSLSMSCSLFAQMHISTDGRQDAKWDAEKSEWILLSERNGDMTFFEFNTDMTMFTHVTNSITSAYRIKSYEYDEDSDIYELDVMSDVGNAYHMVIDIANNRMRFMYERDGTTYMVQHSIKKVWLEN